MDDLLAALLDLAHARPLPLELVLHFAVRPFDGLEFRLAVVDCFPKEPDRVLQFADF